MNALKEIAAERKRQIEKEGWSFEHDDEHDDGSLAQAAAWYATRHADAPASGHARAAWPSSWAWSWKKPKDAHRNLIIAGALILAEIERLDRKQAENIR